MPPGVGHPPWLGPGACGLTREGEGRRLAGHDSRPTNNGRGSVPKLVSGPFGKGRGLVSGRRKKRLSRRGLAALGASRGLVARRVSGYHEFARGRLVRHERRRLPGVRGEGVVADG